MLAIGEGKPRDHEDGLAIAARNLTVTQVVNDWLAYGLNGRAKSTIDKYTHLCRTHVTPALGKRKLRNLSAPDVDRWLADKATPSAPALCKTSTSASTERSTARWLGIWSSAT